MTGDSFKYKTRSNSIDESSSDDEGFSLIPLPDPIYTASEKFEPLAKMAPAKSYSILAWWRQTVDQLKKNGYPISERFPGAGCYPLTEWNEKCYIDNADPSRRCARCAMQYTLNWNEPKVPNCCLYHHRPQLNLETGERLHPCCNERTGVSQGCMAADTHVSTAAVYATLSKFRFTDEEVGKDDSRSKKVYGLDAEFVYTYNGMEVARVSLVDMKGRVMLDTYVLPEFEILDFNTAFSGVEPHHMDMAVPLEECQFMLSQYVNENTILVGHSLEFDLRGLRLCHYNIIDTAILFSDQQTESLGSPRKPALRTLTADLLNRHIQDSQNGHCSTEDAKACLDLLSKRYEILFKIKENTS